MYGNIIRKMLVPVIPHGDREDIQHRKQNTGTCNQR
jgi:hypothetical protein